MTLFNSSLETDSFLATCLARITTGQQKYLKILVPSLQFRFLLRQLRGIFHSYFKIQTVVLSLSRNSAFICGKKEREEHFYFHQLLLVLQLTEQKNFSRNNSSLNELCNAAMTSPNFFSICWRFTTQFASHDIQRYC